MKEFEVIPHANHMEPFAISPDGVLVVHAPTGFVQSKQVYGNVFEVLEASSAKQVATIQLPIQAGTGFEFRNIQYCDRGRYLLAIGRAVTFEYGNITSQSEDIVKVLDMKTYKLHTTISLSAIEDSVPQEVLAKRQGRVYRLGSLQFTACAANSPIAAFIFSDSDSGLGVIKIFDLDTGTEIRGFDGVPVQAGVEGAAVSPLGSSIALIQKAYDAKFHQVGYCHHVVAIIDLKTKRIAKNINLISDRDPSSFPIAFAGESTVAVQLFKREPGVSTISGEFYYHYRASVHFFDIISGSKVQVIDDPNVDDFDFAGMSADGHTLLAYTGKSHTCTHCNHSYGQLAVTDARFTLWNSETGKPIAQSPSLKVIHHTCPWYSIFDNGGWGSCRSSDDIPSFAMSQNGNAVVVTWPMATEPVVVYTLPTH
jgi:WD40 repeat protein